MLETKTPGKVGILEKGLLYEPYCRLRVGGKPAIQIYKAWKEDAIKADSIDCWSHLGQVMVSMMVSIIVMSQLMKLTYIEDHKIWLTSPSGKTTVQLPLYQALRTIRKRGWEFTKVEPVKLHRTISKKEALHILVSKNICKEVT